MPRLPKAPSAKGINPRSMMKMAEGEPQEAGPTGAPPMPRYNARALRPGGMAKGGMVRGDGSATRGHTKGRMV
jgi:hypothetical protein